MSRTRAFTYACAVVMCVAAAISSWAAPGDKRAPGDEPYTPTRLEWAALELNGIVGADQWIAGDALHVEFRAGKDGETVTCLVLYRSVVATGSIHDIRAAVKATVETYGRTRGWSWLKVTLNEKWIG